MVHLSVPMLSVDVSRSWQQLRQVDRYCDEHLDIDMSTLRSRMASLQEDHAKRVTHHQRQSASTPKPFHFVPDPSSQTCLQHKQHFRCAQEQMRVLFLLVSQLLDLNNLAPIPFSPAHLSNGTLSSASATFALDDWMAHRGGPHSGGGDSGGGSVSGAANAANNSKKGTRGRSRGLGKRRSSSSKH